MDGLIEFLRARLADDEQAARAAYSEGTRWAQGVEASDHGEAAVWETEGLHRVDRCSEHGPGVLNQCDDSIVAVCDDFHGMKHFANAAHIARHDPARVLREVEADRRTVDECAKYLGGEDNELTWHAARLARRTLLYLAQRHADHDCYQEEWRL